MTVKQLGCASLKYDPDVARQILNAMEFRDEDELPNQTMLLPELDDTSYYFHCRLLSEAGYISVYELRMMKAKYYWPRELKWAGVQFLERFKDETLWQSTKKEATEKGVGMGLDTLMEVGTHLITKIISSQAG